MSEPEELDALLKARFDCEHQHVPADPFIGNAWRRIRTERRSMAAVRIGVRIAALAAVVLASPWLITGASKLNAALISSFAWASALPGAWMLGVVAACVLLVSRVRSR
jgi:hypothetical protein